MTTGVRPFLVTQQDPEVPPATVVNLFGQQMLYREAGPAVGPVVLLVHGLGSSSAEWGPMLPLLAAHTRVIAPDLPGHGGSYSGRNEYSLGASANSLRDLLDHLKIPRVTLVGHSMGGGVSLMFTYQYPDRVSEVTLISAGGLGSEVTPLLRAATIPGGALGLRVLGSRATAVAMRGLVQAARITPIASPVGVEQLAHGFAAFGNSETRQAFRATASGIIDRRGQRVNATSRLSLTQGRPLLLIHGDRDKFIPISHSANAHAEVPGSQLEIISGAGHYPHLNDPARVAALILDHLGPGVTAD